MGTGKMGVKSVGIFHLFDWHKKSRKKLFANGDCSPEGSKQARKGDNNNVQTARHCLIEDEDTRALSSVKGSTDYSCASSFTDEEGNGIRAPGVVARLMGLDSLPTATVSEPYATPLVDSRSLGENSYQKRGPDFRVGDHFRPDCYVRKPLDLRSQRMPSSPIERFQMEGLPPRSAKSLPITHYKLLSPIKNHSFISGKNAAHIMEEAAKILEPGLRANAKGKTPSLGSSSLSLEVQNAKGSIAVSQRIQRLPESPKYLKGYSLTKSWNTPEDSSSVRASPEWGETSSTRTKGNGKTISLAIQAKVNVQKREGLASSSRSIPVHREQDETKLNQPFKSQQGCRNKLQKKTSTPGPPSGALKQNNQKQNCPSNRDKNTAKSSLSNQQIKKVPSRDTNSRKNRILHKIQGGSKVSHRKEDLQSTDLERDGSSSVARNAPRKKRLIHRDCQSDSDTIIAGNHEKCVQSCVTIDEHRRCDDDSRRKGTDIVSFTFTSPITKSPAESQTTNIMKRDEMSSFSVVMEGERNCADAQTGRLSSMDLNVISGDALSVLLEQKLWELTSGLQSSSSRVRKVENTSASALYPDLSSASKNGHPIPMEHQNKPWQGPCKATICNASDDLLLVNGRLFNLCTKLQGVESMAESSSGCSEVHKEPEQQQQSPLSILEASFSSESCSSSDSSDGNNGSKICSSLEAQNCIGLHGKGPSGEAEMDLSDSASSVHAEISNEEYASVISIGHPEVEMEYVRDIIQNAGIDFKAMTSGYLNHFLDPLLFDLLENKKNSSSNRSEDKNHRIWRKVLFDCVGECLESKYSRYVKMGGRSWAKGAAMTGREDDFASEIYKEIVCWKNMGDWMVDELVDKDMSNNLGKWVDFHVEAFEVGVEIEEALVSCLMDEVVADFIM